MKKFCHECGELLEENVTFCPECGTKWIAENMPSNEVDQPQDNRQTDQTFTNEKQQEIVEAAKITDEEAVIKKPKSRKNRNLIVLFMIVVFIIGGGIFYANHYFSKASTAERFREAVNNKDVEQLMKMLVVAGGDELTKAEVEAFLTFAKEERKLLNRSLRNLENRESGFFGEIIELKESKKLLGIIPRYQVEMLGQYLRIAYPFTDIKTMINGKTFKALEEKDKEVVFGPLLPGMYEIDHVYAGEFADAKTVQTITLWDEDGDDHLLDVTFNLSEVDVRLTNVYDAPLLKATLKIGEKELVLQDDFYFETFGPVSIEGDVSFKVIAEYPWGTIESDVIPIDDDYMEVSAEFVDDPFIESVADIVVDFGEGYYKALSLQDESKMKHSTKNAEEDAKYEISYLKDYEEYFTAKLNGVNLYKKEVYYSDKGIYLFVNYDLERAYYDETEPPILEAEVKSMYLFLLYDEKTKEWIVDEYRGIVYREPNEEPIEYEGMKKQYLLENTAQKKQKQADKLTGDEAELADLLEEFIDIYNESSVETINARDMEYVAPYLDTAGPRYQEQKNYLENTIIPKEITEEHLSTKLESFKQIDEETFEVVTIEEFIIKKPEEESTKKFRTTNIVKYMDGHLLLHELISTKTIN